MAETVSILGSHGMLGSDLSPCLAGIGYRVRQLDLPEFDITRRDHLERALEGAPIVVNCAAFTDVEKAEEHPETAHSVNAEAVGALGQAAARSGAFVLHISTDFIFDGQSPRPYVETDAARPLNSYGRSKLEGEKALVASGCRHAILRIQWSYGRHGTNFVAKMLDRARSGEDITMVEDQIGSPTWTADISKAAAALIAARREGVFHFANSGYASRFEIAVFIAVKLSLPVAITPCSSDSFPAEARRPKHSWFNTAKIQTVLNEPIRSWQDALSEFLMMDMR